MRKVSKLMNSIRLFAAAAALVLICSFGVSSVVYASAEETTQEEQTVDVVQEDNGGTSKRPARSVWVWRFLRLRMVLQDSLRQTEKSVPA